MEYIAYSLYVFTKNILYQQFLAKRIGIKSEPIQSIAISVLNILGLYLLITRFSTYNAINSIDIFPLFLVADIVSTFVTLLVFFFANKNRHPHYLAVEITRTVLLFVLVNNYVIYSIINIASV